MITATLDSTRARLLRFALRPKALRRLYASTPARLFAGFVISAVFYLPIALRRPELLLLLGPLVFGYPHLIASYRLASGRARIAGLKPFVFLAALTALSLGANEAGRRLGWLPEMPFGAWEVAVAAVAIALSSRRVKSAAVCALAGYAFWKLSWREPLLFAASALIAHNWVAFLTWARAARGAGKNAAFAAAALFGLVHLLVFAGYADFLMPSVNEGARLVSEVQNTGAVLAPWSADVLVWYRAVVLYSFGLSMHYYVWLKAIPECRGKAPLSWRRTHELLKRDLGRPALIFTALVAGVGTATWCAAPVLGARIYFRIATLHGWVELLFLAVSGAGMIKAPRTGLINSIYLQIKHLATRSHNIIYLIRRRENSRN